MLREGLHQTHRHLVVLHQRNLRDQRVQSIDALLTQVLRDRFEEIINSQLGGLMLTDVRVPYVFDHII